MAAAQRALLPLSVALNLICPNCLLCSSSFAHFPTFCPDCHIFANFWRVCAFFKIVFVAVKPQMLPQLSQLPRRHQNGKMMLPSRSAEEARGQGCAGFFSQSIIKSELGPAPYGLMALAGGAAEYNTASSSSQPIHLPFFSITMLLHLCSENADKPISKKCRSISYSAAQ